MNFNLTLPSLNCNYVSVDIWDSLGTNRKNINHTVERYHIDEDRQRHIFVERNRETIELRNKDHEEKSQEMHKNSVHGVVLTEDNFDEFIKSPDMAFVDM